MRTTILAALALCVLSSEAQAQLIGAQTCRFVLTASRMDYVQCMHDVDRRPFVKLFPDLGEAYEDFYAQWAEIAKTASVENWDSERFSAESAKLRAKLLIAMQISQDKQEHVLQARVDEAARELARQEKSSRDQQIINDILSRLAKSTPQPQATTTYCSTDLTGLTTCTTR